MSAETPFGRATEDLLASLREGLPGTEVALGPPREDGGRAAVDVCLLGCRGGSPEQHPDRRHQPVTLEFAVAVAGPPEQVADRYHDLWLSVSRSDTFVVEPGEILPAFWTAHGVAPRPALRVSTRVTLEQVLPQPRPVTERLVDTHLQERS